MPRSMTAFARVDSTTPWGDLTWEIRSVNHRFLEPSLRLPESLRALEPRIRAALNKRLSRGKLDVNARFQGKTGEDQALEINADLVAKLKQFNQDMTRDDNQLAPLGVATILGWPGVLLTPEVDQEALGDEAMKSLDQALDQLVQAREREGASLKTLLLERVEGMEAIVDQVKTFMPEVTGTYRERLQQRLAAVREELDSERLEQEMVIFAQKIDVSEELDRLEAHLKEIRRILDSNKPIGRRLDFLMQELNREANTLGSKSADLRSTNASVDLKVLIEQMREQVQNLE